MLTTLSMWGIYFASYLVDYFLILVISVWKRIDYCKDKQIGFWNGADITLWIILIVFIVLSFVIANRLRRMKMNTRIKLIPEKNVTLEMLGYLVAQIIAVTTILYTDWWIPISLAIFILVGFIFVKSKAVYHSPLFVFPLFNMIYSSGKNIIVTNYTQEEMRLAQEDSPDGLEAREIEKNVFYLRKQHR